MSTITIVIVVSMCHLLYSRNMRLKQYSQIGNQLKGAEDVVEEFKKYQAIPQIKYLIDR